MPTENRSSNTEMVSDSEMTECQFHNNCGGWCETRRELEHNLCEHCLESHDEEMSEPAQAPQPQAEPATPYGWHVEWADSGDHYLFTKVEKRIEALRLDSDVKVVQLYTRADPVEVGQLRDQLAAWQALSAERLERLAERDALLGPIAGWTAETREAVLEAFQDELNESASYAWYDAAIADLMKLVEAVSASAEPSADHSVEPAEMVGAIATHSCGLDTETKCLACAEPSNCQASLDGSSAPAERNPS